MLFAALDASDYHLGLPLLHQEQCNDVWLTGHG